MTTILLADDHQIVREGLRLLLESEPDLKVVGEAGDGLEAVRLVERLHPDVLVADLMMPGLSGLDVVREVCRTTPRTRAIVLSMHDNEAYVLQALRNGAAGYVLKGGGAAHLAEAVRTVAGGGRYLSPALTQRAVQAYVSKAEAIAPDSYESLSGREREVLHLAAEGHTNVEIAERLTISPRTVESHRASLMRKLELRSQTDLVRYAIRRGILPLDQ